MAVKIFDLLFFGRPMLVIPIWTVYLHFVAFSFTDSYINLKIDIQSIIHLIFLTLIFKGSYVINQIFDIESDRQNDKLYFLPRGLISIKTAWVYFAILSGSGLVIAYLQNILSATLAAAIVLLGILYSIPGIKLKDRPTSGMLANAVAYGILVPLVALTGRYSPENGLAMIPYFLAIASGYILTTIPDISGDAATGKKTVAVVLGEKAALWLGLLAGLATMASSILTENWELAGVSGITLIIVVVLLLSFNNRLLLLACKLPILLLTLFAGIHFPAYLIILLLTTALTRFYYKKRFDVIYPQPG